MNRVLKMLEKQNKIKEIFSAMDLNTNESDGYPTEKAF